ncbi:mannose-6-phosphate receptor binding domain-containing protein [Mycena sp. CBHHK59/15]|nr:mannose-6-phosphate receptor binding domain-containing protein [Mycena sp. CBHHK59/15]
MARLALSLLLALALAHPLPAHADDKPCTGRHAGKYYDLNPLQAATDYTLQTPGGHDLVLSACKSVSHETWGLKVPDPGLVGGFVRGDHGDFSLGQTNTTLSFVSASAHPHLTYTSGSQCPDGGQLRGSTAIEFVCDLGAGAGAPRLVAQLPPGPDDAACAFFVQWRTRHACPTSEGTTFGGFVWFVFVLTLTLLALYLALGTLYNRFVLGLRGAEQLPRFSLAGAHYHASEAWDSFREWLAGQSNPSSRGYAPAARGWGAEEGGLGGGVGGVGASGGGGGGGGGFVRRTPLQPQTNPASHQTGVMQPLPQQQQNQNPPMNVQPAKTAGVGAGALNPASHQTRVMQQSATPPAQSPAQQPSPFARMATPPPAVQRKDSGPGTKDEQRAFLVGEDEEEGEDAPGQELGEVASVRRRVLGGGGEGTGAGGAIRL